MLISIDPGPHLFSPGASPRENAEGLRVLLDGLVALNRWHLRHHPARPLYSAGVTYARTDNWEAIPALYMASWHGTDAPDSNFPRKWGVFGDCKSLTAALVAERLEQGQWAEPTFRFAESPDGHHLFHILVRTPYGFEDPSAKLGMNRHELSYFKQR